jgi:drug/metabolite transporter (DMT)-like permease
LFAWGLLGEVPDLDETIGIALIAVALAGVLRPSPPSREKERALDADQRG